MLTTNSIRRGVFFLGIFLFLTFPPKAFAQVVINEFIPNPSEGNEKVEIKNTSQSSASLVNWQIDDVKDGGQSPKVFSAEISALGLYVIDLGSTSFLNNPGDDVRLLNADGDEQDFKNYSSSTSSLSWAKDSQDNWCEQSPSFGSENNACSSPTATPIPTPTSAPTSTPAPAPTGIYKIKEVKNENNEVINSIKIYLDDNYICHYPPEDLIFCDGCQHECDGVMVNYGFGKHEIRLERSDYQDWAETRTINAGSSFELNLVMEAEDTTSTSIPTPTPSTPPTASPTPTKKITLTPTPNITQPVATESGQILGEEISTPSAEPIAPPTTGSKRPIWPVFLIIAGFGLLFGVAYYIWYKHLR